MIFIVMMSQSVRSIIIRLAGLTVNSFVYSRSTPLSATEMSSDIIERGERDRDSIHFSLHEASNMSAIFLDH